MRNKWNWVMVGFIILGFILTFFSAQRAANRSDDLTDRNHDTGMENNTYLRTMNCIASVNPVRRTPEYVQSCYDQAEKDTGINIKEYGDAREE